MITSVLEEHCTAVYPDVDGNKILRNVHNSPPDDTMSKSENKSKFLTTRIHSIPRTHIVMVMIRKQSGKHCTQ